MQPFTDQSDDFWKGLLKRTPQPFDEVRVRTALKGKRVLVTGAGGSIGSALAKALLTLEPASLTLLDASECAVYDLQTEFADGQGTALVNCVLGSVCDGAMLAALFASCEPQIIFHAAAFKHVPLMEQHPFEAIRNNAIGTETLLSAAVECGAEQFILVSTDKAVEPISMMGASKRIAELSLLARHAERTCMKAVRLGNVLESEGSIVPLFRRQIVQGGPVTITHREMRRYFMSATEAVETLLTATIDALPGGIYIPKLGEAVRIEDLARYLIDRCAGNGDHDIQIVFTGTRPGDKLSEGLVSDAESISQSNEESLFAVDGPSTELSFVRAFMGELRRCCDERDLQGLLEAISELVPEYRPSSVVLDAANAATQAGCTP